MPAAAVGAEHTQLTVRRGDTPKIARAQGAGNNDGGQHGGGYFEYNSGA